MQWNGTVWLKGLCISFQVTAGICAVTKFSKCSSSSFMVWFKKERVSSDWLTVIKKNIKNALQSFPSLLKSRCVFTQSP